MKLLRFIAIFIFYFFILSCSKQTKTQKVSTCDALFNDISETKFIASGCSLIDPTVPGSDQTVAISINGYICSGVVISDHFLLTAAHCVYRNSALVPTSNVYVTIGNNYYSSNNILNVTKITKHPLYPNSSSNINDNQYIPIADIALIQIDGSFSANKISPIKITRTQNVEENIYSVGFGQTSKFSNNSVGYKRWTASSIFNSYNIFVSPETLNSTINLLNQAQQNNTILPNYSSIFPLFVYMYSIKEAQGNTCYGDSGGPQLVARKSGWSLVSITSGIYSSLLGDEVREILSNNSDDCLNYNKSVNTAIYPYTPWIQSEISLAYPNETITIVD